MFSVEDFDKSIDEKSNKTFQDFFRQFDFQNHEDKNASLFDIGDVLNLIDYQDRWAYKGAIPEPPCDRYVYWNIVRKVYPIELERYEWYKEFLKSKKAYLGSYKNNRKIQSVEKEYHKVTYIGAFFFQKYQIAAMVASSILAFAMM